MREGELDHVEDGDQSIGAEGLLSANDSIHEDVVRDEGADEEG